MIPLAIWLLIVGLLIWRGFVERQRAKKPDGQGATEKK